MIEVKNIKKKFIRLNKNNTKEEFYANNDINIKAKDGEIIGILGPNGAGKTTLLRIISGILTPTYGEVCFDNLTYEKNEIEIKKQFACLSGNTKLYNKLSPYELLKWCCNIYEVKKEEIDNRIKEIANRLNINNFLYNKIENLSTGQEQRVNIARCLIHNPKYYILDEATSGLDIISSQIILDFIKEEKKNGKTILYSTHYMEEAENICDYIYIMYNGKIIKEGTPNKILKDTKTKNLRDAFFELTKGVSNE